MSQDLIMQIQLIKKVRFPFLKKKKSQNAEKSKIRRG